MFASIINVSSSSSFEEIITDYHPKAAVSLTSDIGIKMNINIEINQNNSIIIYIEFLYKDMKVGYRSIDPRQLYLLVNEYGQYITKLSSKHKSILSWSFIRDIKSLSRLSAKIQRIKKVLKRYRYEDLRSINVFTIDAYQNRILARTTIELDADIITIIPQELLNMNQTNPFLRLHSANVSLANYLFLYPITQILIIIKILKNIIRVLAIPLWIIFSMIIFREKVLNEYFFTILNFVGIPAILFRFIPKITEYIIRHKLLV